MGSCCFKVVRRREVCEVVCVEGLCENMEGCTGDWEDIGREVGFDGGCGCCGGGGSVRVPKCRVEDGICASE